MIYISNENIKWFKPNKWHFRKNVKRKSPNKSRGSKGHPSLVVGETKNQYANIGLTSSRKRGNHTNYSISNPEKNNNEPSYLRDDLGLNDKKDLKQILINYRLNSEDIEKVLKIIDKYEKKQKKKFPTRRE